MAWQDRLQQGSFRGVPFFIDDAGGAFGRRAVTHEFPLRETPSSEDMGRRAREFSLNCLLIGADYMDARDRLLRAVETPGPGTLVHPYLGRMEVAVLRARVRESSRAGGMARVFLTVREAGAAPTLDREDTGAAVGGAADAAEAAAQTEAAEGVSVAGQPEFVEAAAAADSQSILDNIEDAAAPLGHAAEAATALQEEIDKAVAAVTGTLAAVTDPLAVLVRSPANLAAGIMGGLNRMAAIADDPLQALQLYDGVAGSSLGASSGGNTPSRQREDRNRVSLEALMRRGAVVGGARAAAGANFASTADALGARDDLLAHLDELLEGAGDDAYNALSDLRAALVRDLNGRGARLPRLVSLTPPVTVPALVLAHRLYGDPERDAEIVARNGLRHPGFPAGGEPLEVLNA